MKKRRSDREVFASVAASGMMLMADRPARDENFSVRAVVLRKFLVLFLWSLLSLFFAAAQAANTPCSGRKGGISHCAGDTFICNDGSVSASQKSCAVYMGQTDGGSMRGNTRGAATDCSCRSHTYCKGPRGGHYCVTDGGSKSYLRR